VPPDRVNEPLPLPVTVRPLVVPRVSVPWLTARVTVRLALAPSPMRTPLMVLSTSSYAVWTVTVSGYTGVFDAA
jgi:hypothetical protein